MLFNKFINVIQGVAILFYKKPDNSLAFVDCILLVATLNFTVVVRK